MRTLIDGRFILSTPTGIGRVMSNLLSEVFRLDDETDYTVLCSAGALTDIEGNGRVRFVETDIPQYSPKVFSSLPRIVLNEKPDLIHFPYFFHPVILAKPYIVTIFDTVYSHFPKSLSIEKRIAYQVMMRLSISRAARIITDSESAKRDIIRFFGTNPRKIRVIHLGVEERFRPAQPQDIAAFKARYGLPENYILYVGNHKPHKNLPLLVAAFAKIHEHISHSLVFLDSDDPGCALTKRELELAGVAERAVFVPGVPDSALPLLFSSADLFVYPSLCEGFGLPPLEAMACGTPVITSNVSSLPEVVDDAGMMVDPSNCDALAEAMMQALGDADLREEMRAKGIERAKLFSWKKTARQTLEVYRDALKGGKLVS